MIRYLGLLAVATTGSVACGDFDQPADQALKIETVVYTTTDEHPKRDVLPKTVITEYFRAGAVRIEYSTGGAIILADDTMLLLMNGRGGGRYQKQPFTGKIGSPEDELAKFLRAKDGARVVDYELVDGITARKYEIAVGKTGESGAGKAALWIDPKTGFPVKVHFVAADGTHIRTIEKFRWNEKLDPKLFSLDPPQGYMPADEKK